MAESAGFPSLFDSSRGHHAQRGVSHSASSPYGSEKPRSRKSRSRRSGGAGASTSRGRGLKKQQRAWEQPLVPSRIFGTLRKRT